MALTIVGTPGHSVTAGAVSLTMPVSGLTAGDKIIACWRFRNSQVDSAHTALGNAMTQVGTDHSGAFFDLRWYGYTVGGGDASSGDVVLTLDGSARMGAVVWVLRGWDTVGSPAHVTNTGTSITQDVSSQAGSIVLAAGYVEDTVAVTEGAGQTERQDETDTVAAAYFASDEPGAATVTMSHSWTGSNDAVQSALNVTAAAGGGATVEQEGYRGVNNDGSESAATFAAAQDTGFTMPVGMAKRLRALLNATGDPAAGTPQLEYRKSGESPWLTL